MKPKKITPKKVVMGFRQIYFTFSQTIKLVWKANPRLLAAVFAVNILAGFLVFPTIYIEKLTIDALVKNIGNPYWQVAIRGLAVLFLFRVLLSVTQSVLTRISGYLQHAVARFFSIHLDILLGKKMIQLDAITTDNPSFKDRYNKVEKESNRRAWELVFTLAEIPNFVVGLASAFSLLVLFNPLIAIIIFLLAIPQFLIDAKYTKLEYKFETENMTKYRIVGMMLYYLTMAKNLLDIKILKISPYFVKRIEEIQGKINRQNLKIRRQKETARFLTFLPQNILFFALSLYLGLLAIWQKITVGSVEMYLRATNSFQGNLTALVGSFLQLYENYLFVTDLVWFLNLSPVVISGKKSFPGKIKKGIEFKNVWFRYKEDQPWILKDINLRIKAGENLAIVGENGAGKTTFIKLLCRCYDPQKGEILVDGVNLKEFRRDQWWESLSVLFQIFESFSFTAREAIGYGRIEDVNKIEPIIEAAKKAQIHEFINSLPLKYENPVDVSFDKGVEPSTGQWQRIGLARVLFRRAAVTILDEPTSNIDAKNEEAIFKTIIKATQKENLILISHRFSTVRKADKICVMEEGRITEEGTHQELIKKRGTYTELFELQAKSYR